MNFRLSVIATLAAALLDTQAETAPLAEFPFEFREGLIWLRVNVSQSAQPLNFLLDTGAGVSVIHLRTAQRLGLKSGERVKVRGVQSTVDGFWPQRLSAKVGGVALPKDFLAVDLGKLAKACGGAVDGLLGADFFIGRVVQIDFSAEKIRLLPANPSSGNGETVALEVRRCGLRVPIRVNGGKPQGVRLDTGCVSSLQWVTSAVRPEACSRQMAIGLAEVSVPVAKTTVQLGPHEFQDVQTGLHEKEIFAGEAGLLGAGLLSRFEVVTIDAKAGRLVLEKRRACD